MGSADREYFRQTTTRPPGRLAGAPVVKWLLILNIGVFFIDILYDGGLGNWGAYSVDTGIRHGQIWRLITFQFLHGNFGHLLFNMIALYFFGAFVEQHWRSRGFLVFYLLCGMAGAAAYSGLHLAGLYRDPGIVGASAGIFGILAVAALIAPNMQVRLLLPPVTLTMKQLALVLLAIGALVVIVGGRNAGGEAGHLGGALAGFLLFKIPVLRAMLERLSQGGTRPKSRKLIQVRDLRKRRYEKKLRPKSRVSREDASEVDRILDKINQHGLQSLTEEERELLTRAGRK